MPLSFFLSLCVNSVFLLLIAKLRFSEGRYSPVRTGENSAQQEFGSQMWHHILGQVALRENGTDVWNSFTVPKSHFYQ